MALPTHRPGFPTQHPGGPLLLQGRSEKTISQLESKETTNPVVLQEVSATLKIRLEAIQNFDEEQAVNIISNTFSDFKEGAVGIQNYPVVHPVENWMEALEKNEKLYERLLQTEREKVELLQSLLDRQQ